MGENITPRRMFGHADGNAFYCSCEESFKPWLRGRPIIVASNNDGCAIAMNRLCKQLGVKMGNPMHELADLIRQHQIIYFSSNYELYGEQSSRMMDIYASFAPDIEVYSIDEAFLDFTGFENYDMEKYGRQIIRAVGRGIRMPICLGIAPTKTLAKAADKLAKSDPVRKGLYIIDTEEDRVEALKNLPIGDVWGIGHQYEKFLLSRNVRTAYDFTLLDRSFVRKNLTVVGERLWRELNGTPCIEMELYPPDKKEICTSRAFGKTTAEFEDVRAAVTRYLDSCGRKLRRQNSYAKTAYVAILTNTFNKSKPQYTRGLQVEFPIPTNNFFEMKPYVLAALQAIFPTYKPGQIKYEFKKAVVVLGGIMPAEAQQLALFDPIRDRDKLKRLQEAVDSVNGVLNLDSRILFTAAEMTKTNHTKLRRDKLSKCPNTKWEDRIEIKAG